MMVLATGVGLIDAQYIPCMAAMQPDHFCCQEITSSLRFDVRNIRRIRKYMCPHCKLLSFVAFPKSLPHSSKPVTPYRKDSMPRDLFHFLAFSYNLKVCKVPGVSSPYLITRSH
jgi:hypothetical protein